MSDSESEDPHLAEEERRIREQYGLAGDDDDDGGDAEFADAPGTAGGGGADDDDVAAAAVAEQLERLEGESERLQEERDLLKEQVGNFEDLLLAMHPVDGVDPAKFMETIMVDGVEVVQDYRDAKVRDLAKKAKALHVKINSLREANEQKVKELATAQMKLDRIQQKQVRRAEEQHKRQSAAGNGNADAGSPRQQKLRKMRTAVQDANRRVEMLNLRGESCARKIEACTAVLRNELGLGPGDEVDPEAVLKDGAAARKQAAEEMSLVQTEVKRLKDKVARAKKERANPKFKSRASLLDVDRQAEQDLEYMNQQRQAALGELRRDNEFLTAQLASTQQKIGGCKQRVEGLSQERQKHLHQLKRVQEKTALDAQLVAAFEAESARLRKKLRGGLRDVKADHAAQRRDTQESVSNATLVLQSELQRKEDEIFEAQQRMRAVQDETQHLHQEAHKLSTQTTARGEVRMIRQLKKANSELWDIIQDYEKKFTMTEDAIEANEAQVRHEQRRGEDLRRQLAMSVDDKGRTVTVRVNEEDSLHEQLEALLQEEQVVKLKYREREKEVDQELTLYQTMCDEIRGQLRSSAGSRAGGGGRRSGGDAGPGGDAQEVAAIMEENSRLRDEIRARQEASRQQQRD